MYRHWKDRVEFLTVYVREAHPVGQKEATPTNKTAGILVPQPTTLEERGKVAQRCCAALHIDSPMVVDEIDNRVGRAYLAWPDRLYVIDRAGRVAYRGGPGPFAFNPYEMEQALLLMHLEQAKSPKK
jgi:type I thyroxine 5'-deiodinase